jgi:hypothetical protein
LNDMPQQILTTTPGGVAIRKKNEDVSLGDYSRSLERQVWALRGDSQLKEITIGFIKQFEGENADIGDKRVDALIKRYIRYGEEERTRV